LRYVVEPTINFLLTGRESGAELSLPRLIEDSGEIPCVFRFGGFCSAHDSWWIPHRRRPQFRSRQRSLKPVRQNKRLAEEHPAHLLQVADIDERDLRIVTRSWYSCVDIANLQAGNAPLRRDFFSPVPWT
jgi:hypothetical protein